MTNGAKDTAMALAGRVGVLVFSVAIQGALAWVLGPSGRGSYAVCLLFATLLATIFTFGVDRAGQYFAASGRMSIGESLRATVFAMLVGGFVAMVVGAVALQTGHPFFAKADRSSFLVALAVIPVSAVENALIMLLIGMRRIAWMVIVSVTSVAVQLAGVLVFVLVFKLEVNGALLSIVVAGVAAISVALAFFFKAGWLDRGRIRWRSVGALLSYGLKFYVAKLSTMVHFRIGTLILAFFVTPTEIGLFAAASQLIARITIVSKAIETAIFSRVATDEAGRPVLVAQTARVTMLAAGALLGVLVALSWPIVMIILSPKFLPSLPLMWIIAPGVLVRSTSNVLTAYFMGTNRPGVCSWSVGLGMLVNFVGIVLLLPRFGLAGAAWAMTLGYVVTGGALALSFRRATGDALTATWRPTKEDVRLLVTASRQVLEAVLVRRRRIV